MESTLQVFFSLKSVLPLRQNSKENEGETGWKENSKAAGDEKVGDADEKSEDEAPGETLDNAVANSERALNQNKTTESRADSRPRQAAHIAAWPTSVEDERFRPDLSCSCHLCTCGCNSNPNSNLQSQEIDREERKEKLVYQSETWKKSEVSAGRPAPRLPIRAEASLSSPPSPLVLPHQLHLETQTLNLCFPALPLEPLLHFAFLHRRLVFPAFVAAIFALLCVSLAADQVLASSANPSFSLFLLAGLSNFGFCFALLLGFLCWADRRVLLLTLNKFEFAYVVLYLFLFSFARFVYFSAIWSSYPVPSSLILFEIVSSICATCFGALCILFLDAVPRSLAPLGVRLLVLFLVSVYFYYSFVVFGILKSVDSLPSPSVCVFLECLPAERMLADAYLVIALFFSKYFFSYLLRPDSAVIITLPIQLQAFEDEMQFFVNLQPFIQAFSLDEKKAGGEETRETTYQVEGEEGEHKTIVIVDAKENTKSENKGNGEIELRAECIRRQCAFHTLSFNLPGQPLAEAPSEHEKRSRFPHSAPLPQRFSVQKLNRNRGSVLDSGSWIPLSDGVELDAERFLVKFPTFTPRPYLRSRVLGSRLRRLLYLCFIVAVLLLDLAFSQTTDQQSNSTSLALIVPTLFFQLAFAAVVAFGSLNFLDRTMMSLLVRKWQFLYTLFYAAIYVLGNWMYFSGQIEAQQSSIPPSAQLSPAALNLVLAAVGLGCLSTLSGLLAILNFDAISSLIIPIRLRVVVLVVAGCYFLFQWINYGLLKSVVLSDENSVCIFVFVCVPAARLLASAYGNVAIFIWRFLFVYCFQPNTAVVLSAAVKIR